MKDHQQATGEKERANQRARILWRDEDSGELLWLVLTGTSEFLEELGHAGYDLRRLPDPVRSAETRLEPNAA
jgi:hypothetical protein